MAYHRFFLPALAVLAIACILVAGCTDSGNPATDTTPVPTTPVPRYSAGDIVKNPSASTATAWIILGYDPATDKYERAIIYPNTGGSWGYRKDDRTDQTDRTVMERVYTDLISHVVPSSVAIVTPTTIATGETTEAVETTRAATATTTAATGGRPYIERIIPDYGFSGTTVKVTDLVGKNFVTGATVSLARNNSTTVMATGVRVISPTSITCDLPIPAGAEVGAWDVIVKNPDGQSYTFTNIFTVRKDMSVVTTTSAANTGSILIDSIDPPVAHIGYYYPYTITNRSGKFQSGASVVLKKDGRPDIKGSPIIVESNTTIKVGFNPPSGSMGAWDLLVTNPDNTFGRLIEGITIG